MTLPVTPVCPDDLAGLEPIPEGFRCSRCRRLFTSSVGLVELLPVESFKGSTAESDQLQRYAASLSQNPDRSGYQLLRRLIAVMGNGFLYSWVARTIESSEPRRSLSILDAACGDGILSRYVSKRHDYAGIDFSSRLLHRARRYNHVACYRADLGHIPFSNHCFDVVVSLQALQYMEHPRRAVEQMARVLKPGGKLLLSLPNDLCLKYRRQGIPQIQRQRFNRETVQALLTPSFQIVDLSTQGFWLPLPKISVHLPAVYGDSSGLAWTVLATPRRH